jgi:hypothetical protein
MARNRLLRTGRTGGPVPPIVDTANPARQPAATAMGAPVSRYVFMPDTM